MHEWAQKHLIKVHVRLLVPWFRACKHFHFGLI